MGGKQSRRHGDTPQTPPGTPAEIFVIDEESGTETQLPYGQLQDEEPIRVQQDAQIAPFQEDSVLSLLVGLPPIGPAPFTAALAAEGRNTEENTETGSSSSGLKVMNRVAAEDASVSDAESAAGCHCKPVPTLRYISFNINGYMGRRRHGCVVIKIAEILYSLHGCRKWGL